MYFLQAEDGRGQRLVEFEKDRLEKQDLEVIARALNGATAMVNGEEGPLLRNKCKAEVRDDLLVIVDTTSTTPNPFVIGRTGKTMRVLDAIAEELYDAELLADNELEISANEV